MGKSNRGNKEAKKPKQANAALKPPPSGVAVPAAPGGPGAGSHKPASRPTGKAL